MCSFIFNFIFNSIQFIRINTSYAIIFVCCLFMIYVYNNLSTVNSVMVSIHLFEFLDTTVSHFHLLGIAYNK